MFCEIGSGEIKTVFCSSNTQVERWAGRQICANPYNALIVTLLAAKELIKEPSYITLEKMSGSMTVDASMLFDILHCYTA